MLHRLRQSSRLATLLVLALCAGPAASALCPHPGGGDHSAMAQDAMPEMAHGSAHHEAPPCHEEPTPEPESADCLSPCCTVAPEAPAPAPPTVLAATPAVGLAVGIGEAEAKQTPVPQVVPHPPPSPPVRVHLLLGRFLT